MAVDINNVGQVAVYSNGHAARYSGGTLIDLRLGRPFGINSSGQVVGQDNSARTFRSDTGTNLTFLTTFALGPGRFAFGTGINDQGQVVGQLVAGEFEHLFRSAASPGTSLTDLGNIDGFDVLDNAHINNAGQIAANAGGNAYRLDAGNALTRLRSLGGASYANALNDAGQVVGRSAVAAGSCGGQNCSHPALWDAQGNVTDLGTLGGRWAAANDVNNIGFIVGWSQDSSGVQHAFLFDGTMHNLNDLLPANSGWTVGEASAINDAGQIVGWGFINGQRRGFIMTPKEVNSTEAPEPASLILVSIALAGVFTVRSLPEKRP